MTTKEYAVDVEAAVKRDSPLHYRVTSTARFLEELLPVDKSVVDEILRSMVEDQFLYDPQLRRWSPFPVRNQKGARKKKENSLYAPFNIVAEAIRVAAQKDKKVDTGSDSEMGPTVWVDNHSTSQKLHESQAAELRPDALLALKIIADEIKPRGGVDNLTVAKGTWWLQLIAAVEMKNTDLKDWTDVVLQLTGYLRRILREQLDRRFVFGFTLGPETMTVWMHDRSGVIGTETSINIHKEPRKFIQVIAAFALLSPEKLGFDPTMKLRVSPNDAVSSYRPSERFLKAYRTTPSDRQWVIKLNNGDEYLTVRSVTSIREGLMRGRGTLVWVVIPYGKAKLGSQKFDVLKQSWRPLDIESEGKLYEDAKGSECSYAGNIELCEEVMVNGQPDTTDSLIRQRLDDSTGPGKVAQPPLAGDESLRSDSLIHITYTRFGDIAGVAARATGSPVARVRTRVLSSTFGWPIKHFSTLQELLHVLRDAIRGHKHHYSNAVLHRDISPGNILINWCPGSDAGKPSTSGRLIDLDHAIKGTLSPRRAVAQPDDAEIRALRAMVRVEPDIIHKASQFFPEKDDSSNLLAYINAVRAHALKFWGVTGEQALALQHLCWGEGEVFYNFDPNDSSEPQKRSRTGTLPYMSGEIMSLQRYFSGHRPMFHDSIHDIESFFWVLVHIGMTYEGPGAHHRPELGSTDEEYRTLRQVVFCFFEADEATMRENKRGIFQNPHDLERYLLNQFHPYFRPLRGLIEEWYHILRLGHKYHAFEYYNIHDMVLNLFDKALGSFPADDIQVDGASQAVLNERKADLQHSSSHRNFGSKVKSLQPQFRTTTLPSNRRHICSSSSLPTHGTRFLSRRVQANAWHVSWYKSMLRPLLGWYRWL